MFLVLLIIFFNNNLPSYFLHFRGGVCLPPEKWNIGPRMLKATGVCSDTWGSVCVFELGINWYWCRETYFWGQLISLSIIHTLHSFHPIAIIGVSATGADISVHLQQAGSSWISTALNIFAISLSQSLLLCAEKPLWGGSDRCAVPRFLVSSVTLHFILLGFCKQNVPIWFTDKKN